MDMMEQWDVSFDTMTEAPNPIAALRHAMADITNNAAFVVTHQGTNKSYEVRPSGDIFCPVCGADSTQPDVANCYNCAIPGTEVGGEI